MSIAAATQMVFIFTGLLFLCLDFISYARKKMVASIGLGWGFICVLMIIIGSIPALVQWVVLINWKPLLAAYVLAFFTMLGLFSISISVSKLIMKNQELAMHVSLLNQENERILSVLDKLGKME